jgi:hypothetical protein
MMLMTLGTIIMEVAVFEIHIERNQLEVTKETCEGE